MGTMAKKKTLAELKAEKKAADERYYEELKSTMNQEFHSVWDGTIKPALHNLKKVMDEVTDRFEDFEDEFKGYLREKKPHVEDVEVNWLDLIYGDTIATKDTLSDSKKEKKPSRSEKRSLPEETKIKHVKEYDKAKKKRKGAQYLRDNDLNSNNIQTWRAAFLAALEATEAASDKP